MRFPLLILLLFVNFSIGFSQVDEAQFRIEIAENTSLQLHDLPIHIDTVVDARGAPDQPLGVGFRGLTARPVDLFLAGDVDGAFSRVLTSSFQQRDHPKSILRITFLSINEYLLAYKQRREIAIEAELAVPTGNGYAVYGPHRITEEHSPGRDLTNNHDEALVVILERIIRELEAFYVNRTDPIKMDCEQVYLPANHYEIQNKELSVIPDGVFTTFMDFRAGRVETMFKATIRKTLAVRSDDAGSQFTVVRLQSGDLLHFDEFRKLWGVQVDGKTYFTIDDIGYEVKRTPTGQLICVVPGAVFDRSPDAASVIVGGALFGLAGGYIAGAMATPNGKADLRVREIELSTGRLAYFNGEPEDEGDDRDSPRVAIVSADRNRMNRPITLTLEDGRKFSMRPNEYVNLPEQTDVCLSSVSDVFPQCSTMTALRGRTQVVFRIRETGRGYFRVDALSREEARNFFRQVDEGRFGQARMVKRVK